MQFIRQEQQFRKELREVFSNINPANNEYGEHPDTIALVDKWVSDPSRDLDTETLESIVEEEEIKLRSALDRAADAGPDGEIS